MATMPRRLCVIYRKNDLFHQYMDALLKGEEVVATYLIPQGESFADHRDRIEQVLETAISQQATLLVRDETCSEVSRERRLPDISLDFMFADLILNRNPHHTVEDNFAWYARQVVQERPVKEVVVIGQSLADHEFIGCNGSPLRGEVPDWVLMQLRTTFPGAVVHPVSTLEMAKNRFDNPEMLLVLDRHCGVKNMIPQQAGWYNSGHNWPYQCMLYILPFETCAAQLASRGIGDTFSDKDLRQVFEKYVSYVFRS